MAPLTFSPTSTTRARLPARAGAVLGAVAGRLARPVDPAGLAAFRVLFGVLVAGSALRFLLSGALAKVYCADAFAFRYPGFAWVPVLGPDAVAAFSVAFVVLGLCIALGLFFRVAGALFTVLFTWLQLVDATNYLNHYWLVILLATLLTASPAHACWSIDAWRGARGVRRDRVPFLFVALLRFQVGCVYVFAAVAKVGADWLLFGQPLGMWLPARDELPLLGPLLAVPAVPLLFSWGGFLYDATIVVWLSWRRTRPLAWLAVLVFHGFTFALFEIGMFPFIMVVATTVFFDCSWPRRFIAMATAAATANTTTTNTTTTTTTTTTNTRLPRWMMALAGLWCLVHIALPLRWTVVGDDVLWDEAGMRFSWRVMVREKSGSLAYRVTLPGGRVVVVSPHDVLTHRQVNEMIGQPDLILQLAHHIRDEHAARGVDVEVRADALVSLNGRRPARFIDPTVDLARERDSMLRPTWVMPAPTTTPRPSWQR